MAENVLATLFPSSWPSLSGIKWVRFVSGHFTPWDFHATDRSLENAADGKAERMYTWWWRYSEVGISSISIVAEIARDT